MAIIDKNEYPRLKQSINVRDIDSEWENDENIVVRAQDPHDSKHRIIHPFKEKIIVEPSIRNELVPKNWTLD